MTGKWCQRATGETLNCYSLVDSEEEWRQTFINTYQNQVVVVKIAHFYRYNWLKIYLLIVIHHLQSLNGHIGFKYSTQYKHKCSFKYHWKKHNTNIIHVSFYTTCTKITSKLHSRWRGYTNDFLENSFDFITVHKLKKVCFMKT